jgi:hypothetical protein
MALTEVGLAKELEKQGYELLSFSRKDQNILEVHANRLHPVPLVDQEEVFIPVPVTLDLEIDEHQKIKSMHYADSDEEMLKHASSFVKNLVENRQIHGLQGQDAPNTSHKVELNEKGQKIIKRKGFSIL